MQLIIAIPIIGFNCATSREDDLVWKIPSSGGKWIEKWLLAMLIFTTYSFRVGWQNQHKNDKKNTNKNRRNFNDFESKDQKPILINYWRQQKEKKKTTFYWLQMARKRRTGRKRKTD